MARTDPNNRTQYWWDPNTVGLSLMRADFRTQEYPPHSHEALVIAVTEMGGSVIKSRGVVEEAKTSRLFVFNPVEPHAGWMGWSERWRYRSFYLTRAAIDEVARGLGVDEIPYFTRNLFDDGDLIDGFLAAHRAMGEGGDAFRERELLIATFGRLFRRHGSGGGRIEAPPQDRAAVRTVIDLMEARHDEALKLDDLAAAIGVSAYQLIGVFKRTVGLTPHAYLTQIRLNAACRHLRRGMPIAEIAGACGFYDQSALTKHFKRWYGITPSQFAGAARAVNFRQYAKPAAR